MNHKPRQRIVISIAEYIRKLWTWMPAIICWTILCAMVALTGMSVMKDKKFTADTSIYILARNVQTREERLDQSDMQVSTQMTYDGMLILKSEQMAERVIANLASSSAQEYDLSAQDLLNMVEVTKADDSLLVTISVTDADPYVECDIANIYRETAAAELMGKLRARGIQTVEEAIVPLNPSGISNRVVAALGVFLGLFSSLVFLFVKYVAHDAIREPEDIKEV